MAANRLMEALNNNGVKAKMLVKEKVSDSLTVAAYGSAWAKMARFLWERLTIFAHLHFSKKHLFEIDIANSGMDITRFREFREADVIHLSWINQGFLSLADIRKIIASGKPIVWTMHDAWPATAICHYTQGCKAFTSECRLCPLLPGHGSAKDLSYKVWQRKLKILADAEISYVTCSRWLEQQARQSALIGGQHVISIPNPIDSRTFCPGDQREARQQMGLPPDQRIILFVSQRVTDERKGMRYLVDAIDKLTAVHPEMKEKASVAVIGGHAEDFEGQLSLPVYSLGYINDERKMVEAYRAADVFVLPSLEDNLPNTIMEAMACGVPCVGFRTGGIPEEIDHLRNGYVAEYKNADDLMKGIHWILCEDDHSALSALSVKKVVSSYSQTSVASRYIEVYNEAMAYKNYKL